MDKKARIKQGVNETSSTESHRDHKCSFNNINNMKQLKFPGGFSYEGQYISMKK